MGHSLSITCADGTTTGYVALSYGTGGSISSYLLDFSFTSDEYGIKRDHIPGVDGNYITRTGRTGGQIEAMVRYIASDVVLVSGADTLMLTVSNDMAKLENQTCSITYEGTLIHSRCSLLSFTKITPLTPTGRGVAGEVYADFRLIFIKD